jgi:hypothetical protein
MFTLESVVPWGRSYEEYCRMFNLAEPDLGMSILGCGDGPASFNAGARRQGTRVISCDPIYRFEPAEIEQRINVTFDQIVDQTRRNMDQFVWSDEIGTVEALATVRMRAMGTFLDDYGSRNGSRRYVAAALPQLPFSDRAFDLALCSHFLFLYSDHFDDDFHCDALDEMCRVATEVRVFPLLALDGHRSPFVDLGIKHLRMRGRDAQIETVPYEFQRGGNQMLRISVKRAA